MTGRPAPHVPPGALGNGTRSRPDVVAGIAIHVTTRPGRHTVRSIAADLHVGHGIAQNGVRVLIDHGVLGHEPGTQGTLRALHTATNV